MNENNEKFIRDVRRLLDESVEDLDGATAARLNQARQRALEKRNRRRSRIFILGSIPAAGLALLLFLLFRPVAPIQQVIGPDPSDLHVLTSTEPLDFYQEDMEFYEWLTEVMENEKDLSGDDRPLPADALANFIPRAAGQRPGAPGFGTDRVSRHI